MKKLLIFFLALMMLCASAMAEVTIVKKTELDQHVTLCAYSNNYIARNETGYALYDINGNVLSATYKDMTVAEDGKYIKVQNVGASTTLNCIGLLDAQGNEILPMSYGSIITYYADDWVFAHVLVKAEGDVGEYSDSKGNKYIIESTDVVYKNKVIGTLSREEYNASYSVTDRGPNIFIKITNQKGYWLTCDFTRREVTAKDYIDRNEYSGGGKNPVIHNPTGQEAFTASCTLTPDQVKQSVWYDEKNARFLDLQGNVLAENVNLYIANYQDNYFQARVDSRNREYGVMAFDGTMVIPAKYSDIASNQNGYFNSGYNSVVDPEGNLYFYDKAGNMTASAEYQLSYSDYKGFLYNAPIIYVKNMGKFMIITATHGTLPETYDEVMTCGENQKVIRVKKDGMWGVIDMAGNTVIPFEYEGYSPSISSDGTVVVCQKGYSSYVLYQLSYDEKADVPSSWTETKVSGEDVDTAPVLAEGAWECPCGAINTGKFCAECGAKKPEPTATPAPVVDDGSWDCECGAHNTGKFCPECGAKRPEATATPAPEPQCASCGYKPEGDTPKFCPECGSKF